MPGGGQTQQVPIFYTEQIFLKQMEEILLPLTLSKIMKKFATEKLDLTGFAQEHCVTVPPGKQLLVPLMPIVLY